MDGVLIPFKYAKIAGFTSLFILKNAYLFYTNGEKFIGVVAYFSYLFTVLHWTNLKRDSLVKKIDILLSLTLYCYGFYGSLMYDCSERYYLFSMISLFAFCCNEYLNSYTLYSDDFVNASIDYKNQVYLRTTLLHTFFLHIFQMEHSTYMVQYCKLIDNI